MYMHSQMKTLYTIWLDIEHFGTPFVICTQSLSDADIFTLTKHCLNTEIEGRKHDFKYRQHIFGIKVTCESSNQKLCLNLIAILPHVYVYRADAYYHLLIWSIHADFYLFYEYRHVGQWDMHSIEVDNFRREGYTWPYKVESGLFSSS